MPPLRWLSFHLALLACALLGAALVVAPALLALLSAWPGEAVAPGTRLLVLQVGTWLAALGIARFYSRRTGTWTLARWQTPLPPAQAVPLVAGHAALALVVWEMLALKRGAGSGFLLLLSLAALALCYLPLLSRLAEDRSRG